MQRFTDDMLIIVYCVCCLPSASLSDVPVRIAMLRPLAGELIDTYDTESEYLSLARVDKCVIECRRVRLFSLFMTFLARIE